MSKPEIFEKPIPPDTIRRLADESFKEMLKFVVDLEKRIIGAGGEFHADAEQMLLDEGSQQTDLWGANYYPDRPSEERLEFTSMINIRPRDGNRKILIERSDIRAAVEKLARHFFETLS